jgi:hypothetical protein
MFTAGWLFLYRYTSGRNSYYYYTRFFKSVNARIDAPLVILLTTKGHPLEIKGIHVVPQTLISAVISLRDRRTTETTTSLATEYPSLITA